MVRIKLGALLGVLALVLTACGGGDHDGHSAAPGLGALGHVASPDDADREVRVETMDTMRFGPPDIEVEVGETITFVIVNTGSVIHEFVLGDEGAQTGHAEHMESEGGNGMVHDEPNAVSVEPGQTKELTWMFTEAGTTLYGCHEPGHYSAGMVGEITSK